MTSKIEFAALSVEYWKLVRAFERVLPNLAPDVQQRVAAQIRYSSARLESISADAEIKLATFDGRTFDASLPVSAVNGDEFSDADILLVETTLEPAIVYQGNVLSMGKVVLKKE